MNVRSGKWEALILAAVFALILGAAPAAAQEPDGAALYKKHCKACHGANGVPSKQMVTIYPSLKALAKTGAFAKLPTDSVIAAMEYGRGNNMKAFYDVLSPVQMTAVAKFITTL